MLSSAALLCFVLKATCPKGLADALIPSLDTPERWPFKEAAVCSLGYRCWLPLFLIL